MKLDLHRGCFCHLILSGLLFSDIPEDEARYWAKKLEQLNAMRDQDVSCHPVWFNSPARDAPIGKVCADTDVKNNNLAKSRCWCFIELLMLIKLTIIFIVTILHNCFCQKKLSFVFLTWFYTIT